MSWYEDKDWQEMEEKRRMGFRDPGGKSALRRGRRCYPCPTCGCENRLTSRDVQLGYQCDDCARREEGIGW